MTGASLSVHRLIRNVGHVVARVGEDGDGEALDGGEGEFCVGKVVFFVVAAVVVVFGGLDRDELGVKRGRVL